MWTELAFLMFLLAPLAMPFLTSPSCNCCEQALQCIRCNTGTTPLTWKVVISGVSNDSCTECATANGTFIVPSQVATCEWRLGGADGPYLFCSDIVQLRVVITNPGGGDVRIQVYWSRGGPTFYSIAWSKTYTGSGSPIDCELTDEDIPYDTSDVCDVSGSTCTITAL